MVEKKDMSKVKDDLSRVRLEVDGNQAINQLGKLEMESKELRININNIKEEQKQWLKEASKLEKLQSDFDRLVQKSKQLKEEGKENTKQFKKNQERIESLAKSIEKANHANDKLLASEMLLNREMEKLESAKTNINKLRDSLGNAGLTMKQLLSKQRDINREFVDVTYGTARYHELESQLRDVNAVISRQREELKGTAGQLQGNVELGFFGKIKSGVASIAGSAGVLLGVAGAIQTLFSTIATASEFEQSISNLSAITGATGEELSKLEMAARRIGSVTTLSAQQTADAFTIIASKKPELLENTDALIATTEAAITLAEAAGIDLPSAADALTNTLNQFGAGAEEANRFINALAAGSKFGAGDIEFLNDAVKRFGPIAQAMNISFEQSVAMMEVFAEKGLESEKAGVQFRNILVKLASGADETNPAIVGMDKAIENLGKQQLNTAGLAKMFGNENLVAAQILIDSGPRFQEFTSKVTGTGVAMEQAQIRVDNFKGDMKSLSSITEEYMIIIGGLITDALRPLVQALTAGLVALKETPKFIRENKDLFIALGIALVSFNTAQITATALMLKDIAVKKAQAIWTGAVTTAQTLLNTAMTANPIGLVIKAVGLLTAGFVVLYNRSEKVRAGIAGIAEVGLTVWEIIKETFGRITDGFEQLFSGDIAGGMKKLGEAFIRANPVSIAVLEGKRLAGAFVKGYQDKLAEEQAKNETATVDTLAPLVPGALSPDPEDEPTNNDYVGQTEKVMRSFEEAVAGPKNADPFKATEMHMEKLKGIHEKFGLDIQAIEKARNEARAAAEEAFRQEQLENDQKMAEAKVMIAQGLSQSLGAIINLIGNRQGELTSFQKALTVAQIAIDTASALSKSIPLAVNAAKEGGPAAPFLIAGYIATMTASIMSGVAAANRALSGADVPTWNDSSGNDRSQRQGRPNTQRRSFYFGGSTDEGLGFGDRYGEFAGYVHKSEYVVPQIVTSDPWVANLLPAIESIRKDRIRGFASGGATSPLPSGAAAGMSTAKLEMLMEMMVAKLDNMPKQIRAYLVYNDLEEMQEEMETLKSRYKA